MGVMHFALPSGLSPEDLRELERACVTGGPDNMPYPTEVRLDAGRLTLQRPLDESGFASVPWHVPGAGLLVTSTASLMEGPEPYSLPVELARGKVNQVRNQTADWQLAGMHLTGGVAQGIRDATGAFGRAVTSLPSADAAQEAQNALVLAFHSAEKLVRAYAGQLFELRHQRQAQFDVALGCRLNTVPAPAPAALLTEACNTVVVPLPWRQVETAKDQYDWRASDAVVEWALQRELRLAAGPLVDFHEGRLPDWLRGRRRDRALLANVVCDYVEEAVKRYQHRIRTWQLSAGANVAPTSVLAEDEVLWLSLQMAETVRRIDPSLEALVGVAQPWGDYLAWQERTHSPFVFADTLLRNGVRLAGLDIELVMGVTPRGSYCRDLLEVSRILDLYAILGIPLQVTLAYPASSADDPEADYDHAVDAGWWRAGVSPESQAEWAEAVAALALAKPYTRGVHWAQFSDAHPHELPNCGLIGADGHIRPALDRLRALRQRHLH